ncbi:tetraspanin-4 isoform X3 [Pogoniulus pusillus]
MAHNCLQCIKYLMFVFNLLFWLGGCGILGVGIWLAVTQGNFATLSSSFPSLSAANLLIVTGTFVMIIGFVGCIGAIKENKCLLLSFFIMLLIVFLLELTVVILFFVYTDKIDKYAQRDLKKGLHLYGTDGNIGLTNAWSIIQTDFRCCGVSNYTDWFEVYNTSRVPDSCCLEFSENCGLHSPGTWWKAPCYETVKIWLQENLLAVGIFGLCTAMVQGEPRSPAALGYCLKRLASKKKPPSKGLFSMQPFPVTRWLLFCGAVIVHSVRQQARTKAGRQEAGAQQGRALAGGAAACDVPSCLGTKAG